MKIALCISGQIRNAICQAYPFIKKNILDDNDVDVFLHTWKEKGRVDATWYQSDAIHSTQDYLDCIELLQPKSFLIEQPDILFDSPKDSLNYSNRKIYNFQYYSMRQSFELKMDYEKKRNIKYDFCIRSRYDFAINQKINFNNLSKEKMYCIDIHHDSEHFNDQFWISSSENADKISDLVNNYQYVCKKHNIALNAGPEEPLYKWAYKELEIELEQFDDYTHPFPPNLQKGMSSPNSIVRT